MPVRVTDEQFRSAVRAAGGRLEGLERETEREIARVAAGRARRAVKVASGRARASVRVVTSASGSEVRAGGSRAPYFGWRDFGGPRRGRGGGIARIPYIPGGRYVWRAYADLNDAGTLEDIGRDKMLRALRGVGIDVTAGGA